MGFHFRKLFTIAFTVAVLAESKLTVADDIAFFYAIDADFRAVKDEGAVTAKPLKVGDRAIQVVSIGKCRIYCVKMGSGAVETAISTEALLGRFHCDQAFSLGPVGGLTDQLPTGAWHKVGSVVAYQKGSWTSSGFQLNEAATTKLEDKAVTATSLPSLFQKLTPITVASGEIFITSSSYREQLRQQTTADAVDMNLFGLVSVCASHHVPLTNWRIVSDKADDNAGEDFRKFTQTYDGAGGKALAELIKNLPPNPNSPQSYPELEKLLKQ